MFREGKLSLVSWVSIMTSEGSVCQPGNQHPWLLILSLPLTVGSWANLIPSLCLSFPINKMGDHDTGLPPMSVCEASVINWHREVL